MIALNLLRIAPTKDEVDLQTCHLMLLCKGFQELFTHYIYNIIVTEIKRIHCISLFWNVYLTFSFIIFVQHAEDSNKNKAVLRPTSAWTDVKETGSTSACSTNRRTRLLAMLSSSKVENPYAERLNTFYSTLGAYKLVGNT